MQSTQSPKPYHTPANNVFEAEHALYWFLTGLSKEECSCQYKEVEDSAKRASLGCPDCIEKVAKKIAKAGWRLVAAPLK